MITYEKALELIQRIRVCCICQNLKIDATAKKILNMIEKEIKNV